MHVSGHPRPSSSEGAVDALTPASGRVFHGHRRAVVLGAVLLLPALAACKGGLSAPGDMTTSQAMIDIGNMIVQLRDENAQLQAQIDSLRGVVAYQDTVVRQLAGAAGLGMRPVSAPVP
jgi:hypothetical protein